MATDIGLVGWLALFAFAAVAILLVAFF